MKQNLDISATTAINLILYKNATTQKRCSAKSVGFVENFLKNTITTFMRMKKKIDLRLRIQNEPALAHTK